MRIYIKPKPGLLTALAFLLLTNMACSPVDSRKVHSKQKPNIVIILADDLGYTDVGCYGATKIKTPAINRLALEGMLFTDAHSPAAACSPSRYGLLTGEYPLRNPMFNSGVLGIYQPLGISTDQLTIASLLKPQGYATGAFGKWHVGLGTDPLTDYNGEVKPGPMEIGFSENYIEPGNLEGNLYLDGHQVVNADPADPFKWIPTEAGKSVSNFRQGITQVLMILEGGKEARIAEKPSCSRVFTEKALDFIGRHKDQPFLLYLAPNNVHLKILPGEDFIGQSDCGLYGDYVAELDWMVGKVLEALDDHGLTENTLVLFTSDNGGIYFSSPNADAFAKGHRINGRFLGQKLDIWEGGHRVPFVVRWPGKVKPGTTSDALVSLVDLMATTGEILDVELPDGAGPDSYSFLHALTGSGGKEKARNTIIYQALDGVLAVRQGSWVLIPAQGNGNTSFDGEHIMEFFAGLGLGFVNSDYTSEGILKPDAPPGQLYDLSADPYQTTNLYRDHPDRVKELTALLEQIKSEQ